MEHKPRIIRHDLQVTVTIVGRDPYVLTVPFTYNPRRPFAVDFDCSNEHGESKWRCDRQALADGRDRQVTDPSEDLVVRPAVVHGVASVFVILRPDLVESATLTVARSALDPFLDAVYAAVPRGRELRHLDWRQALDELIAVGA
jgi:hypothetical protein